jgi:hypothetical protein
MRVHPTQERLLELFKYNPNDGSFERIKTTAPKAIKGMVIFGSKNSSGYLLVSVDSKTFVAQRLAWIISNGDIQSGLQIDHINRDRSDNRLCNLRLVTHMENGHNQKLRATNTSGYAGVYLHPQSKKWVASIMVNYKRINLGGFDTPEEASVAYVTAKEIYHPSSPTQ